jgi:hypothetical protein
MACETRVKQEGEENVLEMDCFGCPYGCSIEDSEACMANIIGKLMETRDVARIMLKERRLFEYNQDQTRMLIQIADVIKFIRNSSDLFSLDAMAAPSCPYRDGGERFGFIQTLVTSLLLRDPVFAYEELVRRRRNENTMLSSDPDYHKSCRRQYNPDKNIETANWKSSWQINLLCCLPANGKTQFHIHPADG